MADATRWRLAMMLDGNALEAVAWSPGGDDSFIHRRLELDTSSTATRACSFPPKPSRSTTTAAALLSKRPHRDSPGKSSATVSPPSGAPF